MKTDFSEKNARRKAAKEANRHKYSTGRANRRSLARGGAFGHVKKEAIVRACVLGTTAAQPVEEVTDENAR